MANVKKINNKSASLQTKKISHKLQTLLIGFDNDKITELVMRDQKSSKLDDEYENTDNLPVKIKERDTVLIKDSTFKREIHLTKDRLLTKDGHLKRKNKDNFKICNNILMSELMIGNREEKDVEEPQSNTLNNNNTVTSDQNKRKFSKDSEKYDQKKRKKLKESEKSDDNISSSSDSTNKRVSNEISSDNKSKKKKRVRNIIESDDSFDFPPEPVKIRITKKGLYICEICSKQFDTKCSIRRHMYIHLYCKKYPCRQCKKVFRKSLYLQAHITRSHPDWDQHYMCNLCNKPFLLKENLAIHMATHTNTETMFKCIYCNEKFSQQHKLIAHERKHLVNGRYNCPVCEQSYDNRNRLSLHFKSHLRVKDFICQHCGKEFLRMNSMRRHVQISHERIRIQCKICKKVLKGHLSEHMRTHEKYRPHKCELCGQCFTQSTQLTVHRRSHTGARPYPCRICSRPFSHSNALMLHIRRHTGEKPFECAMCPLSFSQLPHMKAHMRKIHGKDKPYRCKKCKKFFKLKIELTNHSKKCNVEVKQLSFEEKIQASVQFEEEEVVESAMSLSRMRFLLALLLTMIATKEKLKYLGFNKRLIDDLLVESLEAMGHVPCKNESLTPLKRLKTNIEILLKGTVPKEKMKKFRKEQKSTEDILELLTDEKK